jgi:hypothetical protein
LSAFSAKAAAAPAARLLFEDQRYEASLEGRLSVARGVVPGDAGRSRAATTTTISPIGARWARRVCRFCGALLSSTTASPVPIGCRALSHADNCIDAPSRPSTSRLLVARPTPDAEGFWPVLQQREVLPSIATRCLATQDEKQAMNRSGLMRFITVRGLIVFR